MTKFDIVFLTLAVLATPAFIAFEVWRHRSRHRDQ